MNEGEATAALCCGGPLTHLADLAAAEKVDRAQKYDSADEGNRN
jgi:hypothetical protein